MQAQVGPYRIEGELGRGGMGAVLRARGPDGRPAAVKVLLRVRPGAVERFAREVRLLRELGAEQGFVPILDAGTGPTGPWLAMPLLEGGTLRDRLHGGALGVEQAARLGVTLSRAVGLAHARGVVHRDLKPENVLFTGDGRPLVADLGLAKHFADDAPGAAHSVSLTKTGELKGTVGYMAPEQVNDAKSVGPPTDVFALGAILYEMLAGVAPFEAETPHGRLARLIADERVPLRRANRAVPEALARVVDRALAARPADRFPDAAALAAALEQALAGVRESRRGRAAAAPLLLGAVVLLAGVTGGVAWALGRAGPGPKLAPAPGPAPSPPGPETPAPTPPAPPPAPASPPVDGRGAAVSGALRLTGAWGARTGYLRSHGRALRFTPDGRHVVTGDESGEVVAWDRRDGTFVRRLASLGAPVAALDVAGDLVAAAADDGTVGLWSRSTGAERWRRRRGAREALGLALAPDGRRVAWAGRSDALVVADADGGGVLDHPGLAGGARALAFRAGGDEVLAFPAAGPVVLDAATGALRARFEPPEGRPVALAVAVAANGRRAVTADADGALTVWDLAAGAPIRRLGDHAGPAQAVALDAAGRRAASGGDDGRVVLWDLTSSRALAEVRVGSPVTGVALARVDEGVQLAAVGYDQRVRVWDVLGEEDGATTLRPVWEVVGSAWLSAVEPLGDGGVLVAASGGVERWDTATDAARPLFTGHRGTVNHARLAADGRLGLSAAHDRTGRVWSAETGRELATFAFSRNNVLCCAASADGRWAVFGADDPAVLLIDLRTLREVGRLEAPLGWVRCVAFDAAGTVALATDHEGKVHAWSVPDGRLLLSRAVHRGEAVVDLRGGLERVLTAGGDEVAVWDLTALDPAAPEGGARRLAAHTLRGATVHKGALSPDGRRALVTSLADRTVRLVDLGDGAEVGRVDLDPRNDLPFSCAFADDRTVWVGTYGGLLLRLEVTR